MTPQQARRFGRHVRLARVQLGISARELARRAGLADSTIVRIEQGAFAEPDPTTLESIAGALGIDRAEMYRLVDYEPPIGLLSLDEFLTARYPTLPATGRNEIDTHARKVLHRHGIDLEPKNEPVAPGDRR